MKEESIKPIAKGDKVFDFLRESLGALGSSDAEFVLYRVDGRTMRKLNRDFRGKDKVTDVLSFPVPAEFPQPKGKRYLGEIYLNPAYIKKNKETEEYLALHGLLHLLGFDHEEKGDRIRMEDLENEILDKTGKSKNV